MTDHATLYCACGNRLGTRTASGGFVSRKKGRAFNVAGRYGDGVSITCEECEATTPIDRLQEKAVL